MNDVAIIEPKDDQASQDLAVLQALTPIAVFSKPGGGDPIIEAIRRKYKPGEGDISTPEGQDDIRSRAAKCAKDKKALERLGMDLADEVRASLNPIIAERQRIVNEVQKIQDEVRKPLTDFEEAEKARREGHEAALKEIEAFLVFDPSVEPDSTAISERLKSLETLHPGRDWQEFRPRADHAIGHVVGHLQAKKAAILAAEQERAELERLRAAEAARQEAERAEAARLAAEAETARRVAEAVAEAERKAKEEADKAEQAAAAERTRLENEAREAEERAKKAEADALAEQAKAIETAKEAEAEAKRREELAAQRERDAQAAAVDAARKEEAAREADQEHRRDINSQAVGMLLIHCALEPNQAMDVIRAIAKGQITNVSIKY